MTGRTTSLTGDSSKAGTSKNTLAVDAPKSNILNSTEEHDKWSRSTVPFDFDKINADDFPNFLNDEFSIHKNDEALLADFTALLEDGDDVLMNTSTAVDKERDANKTGASTMTATALNDSGHEILVATETRPSNEQHSQSIGSIMSDHDYLSREDILDIMNNDEENFFSQGNVKSSRLANESMEVNISQNIPPITASLPPEESAGNTVIRDENALSEQNTPTIPPIIANEVVRSILADEVTPLLVKLTAAQQPEEKKLIEVIGELETMMSKLKKTMVSESSSHQTSNGVATLTSNDSPVLQDASAPPTASECESDPMFSCDRSEPLEYYGLPKGGSAATTDDSDDEFISKLKTELNTVDALNDDTRLITKSFRRDIVPSTAQAVGIKFVKHLEKMSTELLKIAAKFKHTNAGQSSELANVEDRTRLGEISKEQLLAEFSSSSSAGSGSDENDTDVRVKRKKKSIGHKIDPNLSQINGIDDEENILVKNEPLLDTPLLNGNVDSTSKTVNVIEELNKWKDYGNEAEFYGFDATDTDDCANSSIEIGVKSELRTGPSVPSGSEKRLEDSEATASEEISKSNGTFSKNGDIGDPSAASVDSNTETADGLALVDVDVKNGDVDGCVDKSSYGPLQNGNDSSSENDASDEGDDNDEEENDREIARLLDFSTLGVKRKISSNSIAPTKINGTDESKKPSKKLKKDDSLDAILQQPHRESDDSDDDAPSDSDDDKMTEEQYLKQHNLNLKNQLLADTSSSESEYDSEMSRGDDEDHPKMNGTRKKSANSDEEDDNDSNVSGSYESLVDRFLEKNAKTSEVPEKKSTSIAPRKISTGSEAGESDASLHSKIEKSKSPSKVNGATPDSTAATAALSGDKETERENADKDEIESLGQSSDSADTPKRKTKIGANLFNNIEKDMRPFMSSDESDGNEDNSKKKASSDESSDCELILDTSLFKERKKVIDNKQLSKLLNNSAKAKATTSRATPDDCISLSSDDELEVDPIPGENAEKEPSDDEDDGKKNRTGRKLLRTDQLAGETKRAQREETERVKRLEKKRARLTQIIESQREQSQRSKHDEIGKDVDVQIDDIILDYDSKKKENIIVHRDIQKHLKSHQIDGIKFMYDCCYGSVDSLKDHPGSGCILAHCMGLGKTLQLISLLHTVISYPQLKTNKVLVICPKSTVLNWKEEIERWMGPIKEGRRLKLFQFADQSGVKEKLNILKDWSQCGKATSKAGCLLLGYEAFRTLVFYHTQKKALQVFSSNELNTIENCVYKCLLKRGATDLVICDEGHMIKNQKSTTSLAVNKIETDRRIILTGTPIQNNLKEYYSMVNFIKPSFLGTEKEFNNLYANPIKSGQHKDSSKQEIKVMKQRSYVLHNKLSEFVQRREAALLKTFLPEKYEYVIFIPMTDVQNRLYEYFLENNPLKDKLGGKSLISDYTILRKIWTHPKVLENAYLNALREEDRRKDKLRRQNNEEDEDERPDDFLDSQEGKMSVKNDWWRPYVTKEDLETILPSNKLKILFEILKVCEENGEKCLIFSAFVAVLDVVEFFMKAITRQTQEGVAYSGLETYRGIWKLADDYYRLDGKTPRSTRHQMITNFNDPKNIRARVFLISAKAGGQGINLTGANRVILLDTSWNPSNDQQNIFRVFRLGQKKICYIYRLLAMGTMEEKVYSRSVTKQAMSCRVVDEQQIDRHYNMAELTELYTLIKPDTPRPTPTLPFDKLLAHLLHKFPTMVYKYHEHDSLLERNNEQDLSEAEKADAWAAYEKDATMRNTLNNMGTYNPNFNMAPGAYDGNFASYNSLYSAAFGGGYGANSSMMTAYLNQLNQSAAYPNAEYQELMRLYSDSYSNPYANYSSMYGANASAAASLYNNALLSSPPPPSNTASSTTGAGASMLGYNPMGSRNLLGTNSSSSVGYNASSNFLSSLVQPPSTAKNYTNPLLSSSAMQMFMNSYPTSSSGGGRVPAPASSPLTNTSKSPATTTSSLFDPSLYSYMQQNSLLFGGSNASSAGGATTSTNAPMGGVGSGSGGANISGSNASSRQGPNAKRNPMLSKELSMMSPRTPFFDSLNLPGIQTSVITKSTSGPSTTTTATTDTSGKKDQRLVSPEPHLIVKNVNAINQTVTKSITPPIKSSNNAPSPNSALNKNSVSITSISKKPNAETGIVTSSSSTNAVSVQKSNGNSSAGGSSNNTSTVGSSISSTGGSVSNSGGGASNTGSRTASLSTASSEKSNSSSRANTNMGIVYPTIDRINEKGKTRSSPTPRNMGIVYPPSSASNPQVSRAPPDSITVKSTAQNQPTRNVNPVESPMTALAAVNKVLQQQNQRRASPNAPQQPQISKSNSSSTPSSAPSPSFPRKIVNSSLTVTPVNKRPFNVPTQPSKTNLSNSITLSPIPSSTTGPQYKTFGRTMPKPSVNSPTPDKDKDAKNNSPKVVLANPNATWQSRTNSMTISKTTVPAATVTPIPSASQPNNNGATAKPRILTMSAKSTVSNQQQQQRSSPVIVRNSLNPNQSVANKQTNSSPTTVRRVIVGTNQSAPQTTKSTATPPLNAQTVALRMPANSKSVAVNKLPTLKNDSNVSNSLLNRKRTASPMSPRPTNVNAKEMIGSNSLSITQVKKPKLSLASSHTRPPPMVRTTSTPVRKPAVGALQNIRIMPRQSNSNSSTMDNSQRSVQDISTMEIVELD